MKCGILKTKCIGRFCCCLPLRPGAMAALFIVNLITLFHLFVEQSMIVLYVYLTILFVLIIFTALCVIGIIAENPKLVLALVIYYITHVSICATLDIIKVIEKTGKIPNVTDENEEDFTYSASNIIINALAYLVYCYFVLVFYSLYIDAIERSTAIIAASETCEEDYEDEEV